MLNTCIFLAGSFWLQINTYDSYDRDTVILLNTDHILYVENDESARVQTVGAGRNSLSFPIVDPETQNYLSYDEIVALLATCM